MLVARLAGATADAAADAERARGELPPGKLGEPVIAQIQPLVEQVFQHAARLAAGRGRAGVRRRQGRRFRMAAGSAGPSPACAARYCATSTSRA